MDTICVMMSTYNGEKYIREQIDSILAQKDVELSLFIRDDGSTDSTLEIIKEYMSRNDNISFYTGDNLGACKSFFDLMWNVDLKYDYYAFADQDDVWLKDKLIRGISHLETIDDDVKLYSSKVTVVDENLQPIYDVTGKLIEPSFGNALIENIVSGCTIVVNKGFIEKARHYKRPERQQMHDWWAYKFGCAYGSIIIDPESRILYRQHMGNTVGLAKSYWQRAINAYRNSSTMKNWILCQSEEFLMIYNDLDDDYSCLIKLIIAKHMQWKMIKEKRIKRRNRIESIVYKIWLLL